MSRSQRRYFLPRLARRVRRYAAAAPLFITVLLWHTSLLLSFGFGLMSSRPVLRPWGMGPAPGAVVAEVSLVRGGVLLVFGGSSAEGVYHGRGAMMVTRGWPVYRLGVEGTGAPVAVLPRIMRPAPSPGVYVVAPLWLLLVPAGAMAWAVMRPSRGPARRRCSACGYPLRGLRMRAVCPECGCPVAEW